MAYSYIETPGDGSTKTFSIPFPFIDRAHVSVLVGGVELDGSQFTWVNDSTVQLTVAPAVGAIVRRKRTTPRSSRLVSFTSGALRTSDLNTSDTQQLYLHQEAEDDRAETEGRLAAADVALQEVISSNDTAVRTAFAAADSAVRSEFAAADSAVRSELEEGDAAIRDDFAPRIHLLEAQIDQAMEQVYPDQSVGPAKLTPDAVVYVDPENNSVRHGSTGLGVVDEVPYFVQAQAGGSFYVPDGNYRVASNWTPTQTIRIAGRAKFYIAAGVTIDFSQAQPDIGAHRRQRFYGPGHVVGLENVSVGWFAGDAIAAGADATGDFQRALDACSSGATVRTTRAVIVKDGATFLRVEKGQTIRGFGKWQTSVVCSGTSMNGFQTTGEFWPKFLDLRVACQNPHPLAVSGIGFDCRVPTELTAVSGLGLYIGYTSLGSGRVHAHNIDLNNTVLIGGFYQNVIGGFVSMFTFYAVNDRLQVSGASGAFQQGEVVHGLTSGAYATLSQVVTPAAFDVKCNDVNFTPGETVVGMTSGATATAAAFTLVHQLGGLRFFDQVEGVCFSDGDIGGGAYSLTTDATVNGAGTRPAFCKFERVFFDSSDGGALVSKTLGWEFGQCWWSNRPGVGLTITHSVGTQITGGGARWCGTDGITVGAGAINTQINNVFVSGVNYMDTPDAAGIRCAAGSFNTQIIGGIVGGTYEGWKNRAGTDAQAPHSIVIEAGVYCVINGVDVSSGGILDNSNGGARITNCKGYSDSPTASSPAPGPSPATYSAGARPTTFYVYGGSVSDIKVAGVTVATSAAATVTIELQPYESFTVTYSSVPTVRAIQH